MKNRLSNIVNRINNAVDSVTRALENSGSGNNQQDSKGSIIDRLPIGESKRSQQPTPVKQSEQKSISIPPVTENVKKPVTPVMQETIIYSMYVCPECRKVFKVKGNDKTVKCSHCEGIHLKDMHIEETVWKTKGKEERDKIISDLLDEEEFEEAFEEIIEENIHEPSKFFDENGQFIDMPVTVKADSINKSVTADKRNSVNNIYFPDDDEKVDSPSGSFFTGFEDLDSGNGIGFGNSSISSPTRTYNKPTYSEKKVENRRSGNKPVIALVVIAMMGVLSFVGVNILKLKQQYEDDQYIDEIVNEVMEDTYADESQQETYDYQEPIESAEKNNYLNENYRSEEPEYSEDDYESSDSYYSSNDYENSYDQGNDSYYDESEDYDEYDSDNSENYDSTDYGQINTGYYWVLNTDPDRLKIHYPNCAWAAKISPENYAESDLPIDELERRGYSTCGHCFR